MSQVLKVVVDGRAAVWTPILGAVDSDTAQPCTVSPSGTAQRIICGGLLAGDESLVREVEHFLSAETGPPTVVVIEPRGTYTFTEGRASTPDLAAAMAAAGYGRARVSREVWEAIRDSIEGADDDDEYDEPEVVEGVIVH